MSMKPYIHLEDVCITNVLQISVRAETRKSLNVCHNMNMKTKLVFVGDRDIHIDMSLCLWFVLQEFGMIWLIDIDALYWEL